MATSLYAFPIITGCISKKLMIACGTNDLLKLDRRNSVSSHVSKAEEHFKKINQEVYKCNYIKGFIISTISNSNRNQRIYFL